ACPAGPGTRVPTRTTGPDDGGRDRAHAASSVAHPQGDDVVAAGAARGLAARVLVPPRGLPARADGAAGTVAGPERSRARAAAGQLPAGAGGGAAELRDRGGDRALRIRIPRTVGAGQGHGVRRGVRDHVERTAGVGAGPGAPLAAVT